MWIDQNIGVIGAALGMLIGLIPMGFIFVKKIRTSLSPSWIIITFPENPIIAYALLCAAPLALFGFAGYKIATYMWGV